MAEWSPFRAASEFINRIGGIDYGWKKVNKPFYMVLDVESIGLHGEAFAFGFVVIKENGEEIDCAYYCVPVDENLGARDDWAWIQKNVLPYCPLNQGNVLPCGDTFKSLRYNFMYAWANWRRAGAYLCADVCFPVETRFLAKCADDNPPLFASENPYPLLDIASIRFAAGLDPLETCPRLPDELPAHNPLNDARQSARLLVEALKLLKGKQ